MLNNKQIEKFKEFLNSGTTKSKITEVAFISIALASIPIVVIGGAAMGNAVQAFKMFNKKKIYKERQITDAIRGLHRSKLIEYVSDKNGLTTVRITEKGKSKLHRFSIDILDIKKPKKWDGKWRIVMFDLPIQYTKVRESLRFKLRQLGFMQFQKSVWINPYPCTNELLLITQYYKVDKYVEIMTVDEITNDKKLRYAFGLN